MSCRRAFDTDLAAFLIDPRGPEWADFREHYPTCADCAAELRVWTELQSLLATSEPASAGSGSHPAEESLLRFEEHPERLSAAERRSIEEHLAECRACADELTALRRFDFSTIEGPAPALIEQADGAAASRAVRAPTKRHRIVALNFASRTRRLVLHPAFAYAIVLALLYPTVMDRFLVEQPERPGEQAVDLQTETGVDLVLEDKLVVEKDVESKRSASLRETYSGEHLAFFDQTMRSLSLANAPAPAAARPGWLTVTLVADAEVSVSTSAVRSGLVLRIPLTGAVPTPGEVEARVTETGGRREIRERLFAPPGAKNVALDLPARWVFPGLYRISLFRPHDDGTSLGTFSLRVQ